ncbi:MAG: hypothetical protein IPO67_31825 [Deltaproteobacteria bacterium]|nr:hypothetical protein [Deltaproteobacteria bacterium]
MFREAGVLLPDGIERLRDEGDVVDAIDTLIARNAGLRRLVVKLNDGFSGEGNAIFPIAGCPETGDRKPWIRATLPHLRFEAPPGAGRLFRRNTKRWAAWSRSSSRAKRRRAPLARAG